MEKKRITICLMCVVVALGACILFAADREPKTADKPKVIVGTFDSRAVCLAFAQGFMLDEMVKSAEGEMEKAKAAGDTKKIAELEADARAGQAKIHKQGFGTASVDDLLEHIKEELPDVAKAAGVDIMVSKWDVVYQNPSAELVDVTYEIIKPFKPSEATLKGIKELINQAPLPREEWEKMDHSD